MKLRPETQAAITAARTAGRILDRWFGRVGPVRLKSARDPVTRADGASERAIRRLLARRFPRIGFLGEEGGTMATGPDGRWIVDPLDGTIAFVAGLPTFGVSIALERAGRLEVGVMLVPAPPRAVRGGARPGRVAQWPADPRHPDPRHGPLRSLALARGRPLAGPRHAGAGRPAGRGGPQRCHGRRVLLPRLRRGGRLDGYWERQAHPWDVAAGALLVREAGGRVTGGAGQPFDVDEATIVASNGRIHERMVARLNGRRSPARRTR